MFKTDCIASSAADQTVERFRYIDALRGIAIIMVVMHHAHPYFAGINNCILPPFFEAALNNGDKGVTLFFLMSAYTLCLSLGKKKGSEVNPVRNYFLRRVFRIVPLYYFAIMAVLMSGINAPSVHSVTANIFFIHGLNPNWINSTIPGGWSVGIEVLFYLVFPFLFFRIKSAATAINITLIFMLIAKILTSIMSKHQPIADRIAWSVFTYENIISQLPVFLIGICLYRISVREPNGQARRPSYHTWLFLSFVAVVHLSGGNIFKEHYLFAIAFGFLAYGLSAYPVSILVNKATVWIGKLSYSIYLVHLVVANLLVKYHLNHYSSHPIFEVILRFALIFTASVCISWWTYTFIELPCQRFGQRLLGRLNRKEARSLLQEVSPPRNLST